MVGIVATTGMLRFHAVEEPPSPLCVVTMGKESFKSNKKVKTHNPVWKHASFVLYVEEERQGEKT